MSFSAEGYWRGPDKIKRTIDDIRIPNLSFTWRLEDLEIPGVSIEPKESRSGEKVTLSTTRGRTGKVEIIAQERLSHKEGKAKVIIFGVEIDPKVAWLWAGGSKRFTATVEGKVPDESKFRWYTDYGKMNPPVERSVSILWATRRPEENATVTVKYKTTTDSTERIRVWPNITGFSIRVLGALLPYTVKSGKKYTYEAYDFIDGFRQSWGDAPDYPQLRYQWTSVGGVPKIQASKPKAKFTFSTTVPFTARAVTARAYFRAVPNGPGLVERREHRPIFVLNEDAIRRLLALAVPIIVLTIIALWLVKSLLAAGILVTLGYVLKKLKIILAPA